jgi:hypothetical protein
MLALGKFRVRVEEYLRSRFASAGNDAVHDDCVAVGQFAFKRQALVGAFVAVSEFKAQVE